MLKENQLIEIPWTQTAQKYFNEKGYSLFKGETIQVKPEELPEGSHRDVVAICDFCGKEITVQYKEQKSMMVNIVVKIVGERIKN